MSQLEFYNRFHQMSSVLNAFAYNLTKNTEESKDLFQETAFRAMTNIDKFRPDTNLKAWLFTIMKNIFINNKWGYLCSKCNFMYHPKIVKNVLI